MSRCPFNVGIAGHHPRDKLLSNLGFRIVRQSRFLKYFHLEKNGVSASYSQKIDSRKTALFELFMASSSERCYAFQEDSSAFSRLFMHSVSPFLGSPYFRLPKSLGAVRRYIYTFLGQPEDIRDDWRIGNPARSKTESTRMPRILLEHIADLSEEAQSAKVRIPLKTAIKDS